MSRTAYLAAARCSIPAVDEDEVLTWRGRRVAALTVVAKLAGTTPGTYRGWRVVHDAPPPITYLSSDWGGAPRPTLLTHPDTGAPLYDVDESLKWVRQHRAGDARRRGRTATADS